MKKYKPYLTRVDLVKNQVEREKLAEQEAKASRKKRAQQQNRERWLRYQEQLRSELAARYFHGVVSAGGESFSNTKSLNFDGLDDYVDCGTGLGDSQGTITSFSVSMWIKPSVTSGNDLFFNIGSFANSFGQIAFQLLSNTLYVKLNNGTRNYNIAYTNTTAWQHLVFVYDGSNSANTKMYINNVEQSPTVGGVFPSSLDLTGLKTIIGAGYSVVYPYAGRLDEVSYFDRTLSASDVNTIYGTGVPNDINSLTPINWYRFEGTGATATDSGTGGNDGTINGATRDTDVPG